MTAQLDDERFMREALAEARAAEAEGEVPIGAVVVYQGEVIARAHNRRETDADPSAHAEFRAMVEAARVLGRWRLAGCTVYVTLEPCPMCAGLMVNARIDRCVFGAVDPKAGATGSLFHLNDDARLNHAFPVTAGVCEDECAALLRAFFAARRGKGATGGAGAPSELTESGGPSSAADGRRACEARGQSPQSTVNVLLAVDSFKGSATSAETEGWLAEGIERAAQQRGRAVRVRAIPVADGGEGTVEAVRAARGGEVRVVSVAGPAGDPVEASYLLLDDEVDGCRAAVIEMAAAAGIGYSERTVRAALAASTRGIGELVCDAAARGVHRIYLGLGGSATSDGGAGFLQALGARVLDRAGDEVMPGLMGLRDVDRIDLAPACQALANVEIVLLSDVNNPLVGARGALRVFGPQKGLVLEADDLAEAEGWMTSYAAKLTAARDALDGTPWQVAAPGARPRALAGVPGAGAAGGLAAAVLALGARLVSGIDAVLDLVGFDQAAREADLVITGEGFMDAQTARGKAPVGVAARAKRRGLPVIAVAGGRAEHLDDVYAAGIDLVIPACRRPVPLEHAMTVAETRANLIAAGEAALRAYLLRCR